ncbi:phosphoglucosamine mutase [Thermoproteota archaeon]
MADNAHGAERLFGTDGIRGTPGVYPLTDGMIFKIGCSISKVIQYKQQKKENLRVIIGKDTRLSGGRIESLLCDAVVGYGIDVVLVGIMTTPGLSFLVRDLDADMGIMISASHNKASDNGIKFFNAKGHKLLQQEERWIEKIIFEELIHTNGVTNGFKLDQKGRVSTLEDASSRYISFLTNVVQGLDLKGMRIAIDCAWGATSLFARELFEKLGARVFSIHDLPQGENINQGGTMDPCILREVVLQDSANIGIAFDGDGDRGIVIDEKGNILDGDYILAIIARYLLEQNKLAHNSIVATVMSNYGLKVSIEEKGGKIITTKVGDKHVLEALINNDLTIGGEQSGHIVFLDYLPTPDGMLTALMMLKVVREKQVPLSELASCMQKFPQTLINVKVREKKPFEEIPSVKERLKKFESQLKDDIRILLRYSGTEPLARIMVEGKDKKVIEDIARSIADRVREEIGIAEEEAHA